jgi:hypothetical protein
VALAASSAVERRGRLQPRLEGDLTTKQTGLEPGWYYWLPDSTRVGPFDSEAEAASEAASDERAAEEEAD